MFKNMTLGGKIGFGFTVLLMIGLMPSMMAVLNMKLIQRSAVEVSEQNLPAVSVSNDLERCALLVVLANRNYLLTEQDSYRKEGQEQIQTLLKHLKVAKDLAEKNRNSELYEGVQKLEMAVLNYRALADESARHVSVMVDGHKSWDASQARWVKRCSDCLDNQSKQMQQEVTGGAEQPQLKERFKRMELVGSLMDLGNSCGSGIWKSQAQRDPGAIDTVMINFEKMESTLDELKLLTHLESGLKAIEECRGASHESKAVTGLLRKEWLELQDLEKQCNEAGNIMVKEARVIATRSMGCVVMDSKGIAAKLVASSSAITAGLIVGLLMGIMMTVLLTKSITVAAKREEQSLLNRALGETLATKSDTVAPVSQRLQQLAELKAGSLISEQELQTQRKRILDGI